MYIFAKVNLIKNMKKKYVFCYWDDEPVNTNINTNNNGKK